jgi:hypothetical protein
MFLANGSRPVAPPFPQSGPGGSSSPRVVGTMKALRLPARAIPVAYWFASEHHAIPPVFVLAAWRSQIGGGPARARALVQPAAQGAGSLSRGHERDLSGSQAIRPVPLPRSKTPVGPTSPWPLAVSSMLPPLE